MFRNEFLPAFVPPTASTGVVVPAFIPPKTSTGVAVPKYFAPKPYVPYPGEEIRKSEIVIPLNPEPSPPAVWKAPVKWSGTPDSEIKSSYNNPTAKILLSFKISESIAQKEIKIENYTTLCRIINIVDGDTIDVLVFLPLAFFSSVSQNGIIRKISATEKRVRRKKGEMETYLKDIETPPWPKDFDGIIVKTRIRFLGIDAAEKNTKQGLSAREVAKNWAISNNWLAVVSFFGKEKWGRSLGVIYPPTDSNIPVRMTFADSLNHHILTYKDVSLGTVAHSYAGEKREQWGSIFKK